MLEASLHPVPEEIDVEISQALAAQVAAAHLPNQTALGDVPPGISVGRYHEVRFEELERDPLGQVELPYEKLRLPGFAAMRPALEKYVGSLAGYRKNTLPDLAPGLRERVAREWRRSFEEWGYSQDSKA